MTAAATLLSQWLRQRLPEDQLTWLETQITRIGQSNSDRELHITLGMIPRKLGRTDLRPTPDELASASEIAPGWNPQHWSVDIAARVMVVCELARQRPDSFAATITDLCRNADLAESIALYSGVAFYPTSKELDELIGDGLRTNIRSVFEAIAHHNPYPAREFDENRWNHMVLKALFIDSTLSPVYGLDQRANAELARILCDYADERRAAGRVVTWELWRCVGPFAEGPLLDNLAQAADSDDPLEQQAALLALSYSPAAQAQDIIAGHPTIAAQIANGTLTWDAMVQQATQDQSNQGNVT